MTPCRLHRPTGENYGRIPATGASFLSGEHLQMVEPIIRFGQKEIQPHVMAWEENGAHPKELVKQFGALGY
jgi:hypothetical protein